MVIDIHIDIHIGEALRAARAAEGLKTGELAKVLGISIWTLSRVEHDKRRFDINWIPLMPPRMRRTISGLLRREIKGRAASGWRAQTEVSP